MLSKKNIAFTLAEVLIVMAIIGVVAAITLPSLQDDVEDRKVVAATRKVYPELDGIYQTIIQTYGKPYAWTIPNGKTPTSMFGDYFKEVASVTKDCGTGAGCFKGTIDSNNNYRKFLMKDGSSVGIYLTSDVSEIDPNDDNFCHGQAGYFLVDVNGVKGENDYGYDVFQFEMCKDGLKPAGANKHSMGNLEYTAAWVIEVGNRDYLNCNTVDWNSNHTCD